LKNCEHQKYDMHGTDERQTQSKVPLQNLGNRLGRIPGLEKGDPTRAKKYHGETRETHE